MPIVTVKSLPPREPSRITEMLSDIRDSGAKALGCDVNNVWVIFEPIPPSYYVHGLKTASEPNSKTHPPIVTIKANQGRTKNEREAFMASVATAVGKGLSIPSDQVWIHYQEMNPEDIRFQRNTFAIRTRPS